MTSFYSIVLFLAVTVDKWTAHEQLPTMLRHNVVQTRPTLSRRSIGAQPSKLKVDIPTDPHFFEVDEVKVDGLWCLLQPPLIQTLPPKW